MDISKNIFRNYDIRGTYPDELNETTIENIGRGLGSIFSIKGIKNVVLGHDIRESSESLSQKLISGLIRTGCNVTYVNIVTTPMIHFFTCTKDFGAGISVTASHNPKNFNGVKIDYKNARPFYGSEIMGLYDFIKKGDFVTGSGTVKSEDLSADYVNFLQEKFSLTSKDSSGVAGKKLRIYVNCFAGTASEMVKKVFDTDLYDFVLDNCEFDPSFKLGVPNPENPEFMSYLSKKVVDLGCDLGITFDNDCDRFGVVDEKGTPIPSDRLLLLFASDILSKNPGVVVISDVKSSQVVEDFVIRAGGIYKMLPTGRSRFLEESLTKRAILGGEFSGHFFFSDRHFGFDDAIYTSLRLLELVTKFGKPLSVIMSVFPARLNSPELKAACPDDKKFEIVEEIKQIVSKSPDYKKLITIDGVRAYISKTGWFLIRASNTAAYLSIRVEGKDKAEVDLLISKVVSILSEFRLKL